MAAVHLGYFEDFKSTHTLLVDGDAEGLRQLAGILRSLESGSADIVEIDALPFVESHHGVRLCARRGRRDALGRVAPLSTEFTWERTAAGWKDAVAKVEALLGLDEGHQYLESAGDHVVVEISKGEYGSEWWRRHG